MNFFPRKALLLPGVVFGLFAVLIGAFGAHTISRFVPPPAMITFETGVRYQFYHALALLALGTLGSYLPTRQANWSAGLFVAGIFCFSGSLYLITALRASFREVPLLVGLATPIGGVLFIAGWIAFCAALLNAPDEPVASEE